VKLPLRRLASLGIAATLVVGATGCGSDGSPDEAEMLPRELGEDLAQRSDSVLRTLEDGDGCTAKAEAEQLRSEINEAIEAKRVPVELEPELRQRSTRLIQSIKCAQPPPPPPPPPPVHTGDGDEEDDD
jgi:hypothetical protein